MICIACIWIIASQQGYTGKVIMSRTIDLLKNCFPPSLLFIMTASVQISSSKLFMKGIFTLKSNKIIEGGAIKTLCFDKTGTLTELDIKIFGFVLKKDREFDSFGSQVDVFVDFEEYDNFIKCISCCHSLDIIHDQLVGDPLEISMFNQTKSKLGNIIHPFNKESIANFVHFNQEYQKQLGLSPDNKFILVRINDFDSNRKRMSVVVKDNQTDQFQLFCKGAPEVIK